MSRDQWPRTPLRVAFFERRSLMSRCDRWALSSTMDATCGEAAFLASEVVLQNQRGLRRGAAVGLLRVTKITLQKWHDRQQGKTLSREGSNHAQYLPRSQAPHAR